MTGQKSHVGRRFIVAVTLAYGVAVALAGTPLARSAAGGSIVGVVTTKEGAPHAIRVTVDPNVCGESLPDESISVDASGNVGGAVVTVTGVRAPAAPAEAIIVNDRCRFVPHVSLVRPKGAVRMSSKDPVMHTMHAAASNGKALFNLSLPIPNVSLSRPLDKPGVVTLSCSTHTWMRGYVFVADELSAMSGADGAFRVDGVPAGPREIRVWHETLKSAPVQVMVRDGETTRIEIALTR